MLEKARARSTGLNVNFVQGDFRSFDLGATFDAAVCGGDSLNYAQTPGEVTEVFRGVARHLRRGGLFAFDVLDHRAFSALASVKTSATVGGERFEVYYFYDPDTRIGEARAVFPGAIERHWRIPIEQEEVQLSAQQAGLEVVEAFSTSPLPCWLRLTSRKWFYLLRKP